MPFHWGYLQERTKDYKSGGQVEKEMSASRKILVMMGRTVPIPKEGRKMGQAQIERVVVPSVSIFSISYPKQMLLSNATGICELQTNRNISKPHVKVKYFQYM